MAEITEAMCKQIIKDVNSGKLSPLTQWEQYQLAVQWLRSRLHYMDFEIEPYRGRTPTKPQGGVSALTTVRRKVCARQK